MHVLKCETHKRFLCEHKCRICCTEFSLHSENIESRETSIARETYGDGLLEVLFENREDLGLFFFTNSHIMGRSYRINNKNPANNRGSEKNALRIGTHQMSFSRELLVSVGLLYRLHRAKTYCLRRLYLLQIRVYCMEKIYKSKLNLKFKKLLEEKVVCV